LRIFKKTNYISLARKKISLIGVKKIIWATVKGPSILTQGQMNVYSRAERIHLL
jgi:hypothetical protein